jgi:alkylhydroperoxidase family enzyme
LVRKGLTEADVQYALGDLDHADLPPKTVAALRLADLLTAERPAIGDEDFARMREELDEGEILELSAVIVIGSGWQRMIEAFGIRPDHWSEATPMPWQPGDQP